MARWSRTTTSTRWRNLNVSNLPARNATFLSRIVSAGILAVGCIGTLFLPIVWVMAQEPADLAPPRVPRPVFAYIDEEKQHKTLTDSELYLFERRLWESYANSNQKEEIFSLHWGRPGDFASKSHFMESPLHIVLRVRDDQCKIEVSEPAYVNSLQECTVSRASLSRHLSQLESSKIESLPSYLTGNTIGGNCAILNHLHGNMATRVLICNPPDLDDDIVKEDPQLGVYTRLLRVFSSLRRSPQLKTRYLLADPIPGFEILRERRHDEFCESTWKVDARMGVRIRSKGSNVSLEWREGALVAISDLPMPQAPRHGLRNTNREGASASSADGRWTLRLDANDQLILEDKNQVDRIAVPREISAAQPLAFLESRRQFLVCRARLSRENKLSWRFFTFDPASSKIESQTIIDEVESWWFSENFRAFQPVSGSKTRYWGAIVEPTSHTTRFGQFDIEKMRWVRGTWIPGLLFQTRDMFVDETRKKVCVVHEGNLIGFDFPEWEFKLDELPH